MSQARARPEDNNAARSQWQKSYQRRIVCAVTTYDENVLQQYADSLYRQAKWIVVWTAVRYGLTVFLVSLVLVLAVGSLKGVNADTGNTEVIVVLILTLVGIVAGVDAGRRKAFNLKLQAQQILCQRQTEINTRAPATRN